MGRRAGNSRGFCKACGGESEVSFLANHDGGHDQVVDFLVLSEQTDRIATIAEHSIQENFVAIALRALKMNSWPIAQRILLSRT